MIEHIARVAYEADRAAADGTSAHYGPDLLAESLPWRQASRALREAVMADVEAVLRGQDHSDPVFVAIVREMAEDEGRDLFQE